MTNPGDEEQSPTPRDPTAVDPYLRAGMNALGGAIPIFGGLFAAAAGYWSEQEQADLNKFIRAQLAMMQDELREKQKVLADVIIRLDVHDEEIKKRIRSDEYQTILKKAFRNWAGTESRKKQAYVRNLLSNAAAATLVSDDVVLLFLDWLNKYSEFHFAVIADIYQNPGSSRGETWERLGKGEVREDSAEADLFKVLIRDLSTGGVIRQHRETDYQGNFISRRPAPRKAGGRQMASAFDDKEQYELTALGRQFIHYVMTELTPKIAYQRDANDGTANQAEAIDATP